VNRFMSIVVPVLVFFATSNAHGAPTPVTMNTQGWTIIADPGQSTLSLANQSLGVILQDVRINLESEHALHPVTDWSIEQTNQSLLTIRTTHPIAAFTFQVSGPLLKISSTYTNAVLTAQAPAPISRIPARLLDTKGFPVQWAGTDEAMLEWGGHETRSPSYLPTKNPEVMYFGLGQVSGSAFHSLFDRSADVAIAFSDQTSLRRSDKDENVLEVAMPIPGNASVQLIPDYYTKVLGAPSYTPLDDSYFRAAPMVWSSWTGYYADVSEKDIVSNTDWLAEHLKPYGFQYVQLDDGFDRHKDGSHSWIEDWDKTKFPHGPRWLTDYIKAKGFQAGLWIVPNVYAGALDQHPEWYLHTIEGAHVIDYVTPAVDQTNPEVVGQIKKIFTTLNDWGFEYYKFDGEGSIPATMPELDRSRLYDPSADSIAVYRDRMKVIRDAIGPHAFLEGCPAGMPLHGIGYFNSFFNGNDVYNNWQGMHALFSSINGNGFFNHIFAYVMPGEGLELSRPMTMEEAKSKRKPEVLHEITHRESPATGVGVTDAEARTVVSYVALTGVAYPVGNVMTDLPAERLKLLQQTMPTMPIVPLDLFSRGTESRDNLFRHVRPDYYLNNFPEILDLKVNEKSGTYDVVGLTNWRSEPASRTLSLVDKLGLPAGSYIAFDFWNQKVLGVVGNELTVDIEPHDTRVLSIQPALGRPQLVGNSRHITGAFSVLDQQWDNQKLSGTVEPVPGDTYTLWFYLPKGVAPTHLALADTNGHAITEHHQSSGEWLSMSFQGQQSPVRWQLSFPEVAK
jgi:Melibiase/Alpha galactosidase C-terminal beta sandwich domain